MYGTPGDITRPTKTQDSSSPSDNPDVPTTGGNKPIGPVQGSAPLGDDITQSTFAVLASEEAAPDTEDPSADVAEVKPVELTGVDPTSGEVISGGDETSTSAAASEASPAPDDAAAKAALEPAPGDKPSVPAATDKEMEAEDAGKGAMGSSISDGVKESTPDPSASFQGSSKDAGAASTDLSLEAKPAKDEGGGLAEEMEKKLKVEDKSGEDQRVKGCS